MVDEIKTYSIGYRIGGEWKPQPKPISPVGENRKSRRKRKFATKKTLKQKTLSIGTIMALENLQRMFEDKNENI